MEKRHLLPAKKCTLCSEGVEESGWFCLLSLVHFCVDKLLDSHSRKNDCLISSSSKNHGWTLFAFNFWENPLPFIFLGVELEQEIGNTFWWNLLIAFHPCRFVFVRYGTVRYSTTDTIRYGTVWCGIDNDYRLWFVLCHCCWSLIIIILLFLGFLTVTYYLQLLKDLQTCWQRILENNSKLDCNMDGCDTILLWYWFYWTLPEYCG